MTNILYFEFRDHRFFLHLPSVYSRDSKSFMFSSLDGIMRNVVHFVPKFMGVHKILIATSSVSSIRIAFF